MRKLLFHRNKKAAAMTNESVNFTNVYCAYVKNMPHGYPGEDTELITVTSTQARKSHTGWQIIPNMLWRHYVTPKQWAEFQMKYQAYHVKGAKCTVFNPIPITTSLAIQRTNTFAAFNNCTYCLGYSDEIYETYWHPWYSVRDEEDVNLFFKEGIFFAQGDGSTEVTQNMKRVILPPYYWKRCNAYSSADSDNWGQGLAGAGVWPGDATNQNPQPAAVEWDPLNRPDKVMELRAGKNAIDYSWSCHPADANKWVNIDQLVHWTPWTPTGPYCGGGRPKSLQLLSQNDPYNLATYGLSKKHNSGGDAPGWFWDYTVPNWANMPIVPMAWFWKEMQQSIILNQFPGIRKPDIGWPGTEAEQYLYGPTQWFIKGIPLLGSDEHLIETTTMVAIKITLELEAKTRESAIYAPTWGPFAWRQLYSHTKGWRVFQPSMVRYRTGGMRRTWQNFEGNDPTDKAYPRETPYETTTTYSVQNRPKIIGEEEDYIDPQKDLEIRVRYDKQGGERVVMERRTPERPPRTRFRSPTESEGAEVRMMKDLQMG
ncbi:capsid protein [Pacific black duck chaphamaparvovirus 1]|uniref:Capsid protein n=1 Tax=Pacific black duck chaphamaparvovirus 1 TaxID=2759407 RepID=A0A7D6X5P5_9VIRU|nr:capsid protein [Pacific black duck chaphamaparvovirus 1]QMI57783.1 capsid protein [Pacific black duck chaphamaparvovirus 1]